MYKNPVYRAIVTQSDSSTGYIAVRIPALSGASSTVEISKIGRTAYNGVWQVPAIGSQIVVTADDYNLTNVFWLQVDPGAQTTSTEVGTEITDRITALESSMDAALLGVFNLGSM